MQKRTFVKLVSEIKPSITKESFFEVTTALALYYFAKKKVDFVVAPTHTYADDGTYQATLWVTNPLEGC